MKKKSENAQAAQVVEFEKDGVLLTFGEEEIRELIDSKDFWYKQWCDVKSTRDKLQGQIEFIRPFLESVNLYQVLTIKK